ncbi:KdsC family phosphatase [Modicisalibacter luteus]|uniref:3-deoxy-D-manno-octulosonate 8-phosphate phosphatase KdsC n=1 Tax=Modicisalibacter luteus TaxID=453962 RepID=A0ABV7LXQ8_9GAMM|nr:HAD hydrolase family protein [Halomonas lutea]GHB05405.1 hypothetical protein GCM10007159_29050 [Halomonas lutea]
MNSPVRDKRLDVKLVLFDVDGVLTDGTLFVSGSGEIYKAFNAKDGVAVSLLKNNHIGAGVISGKDSPALRYRAKQLGMDSIKLGVSDKVKALHEIIACYGITYENVCFVGDDIVDYDVMSRVGVSYAPSDAHPLIKNLASFVTISPGGKGVAREVAEDILHAQGMTLEEMYRYILNKSNLESVMQ